MSQKNDRPSADDRALFAKIDELIDKLFISFRGRLRLDRGTPRTGRIDATARKIDAMLDDAEMPVDRPQRFRNIRFRLLKRMRDGVLTFAKKFAIREDIVRQYFTDRQSGIGRAQPRDRGRQGYANKRFRPALQ